MLRRALQLRLAAARRGAQSAAGAGAARRSIALASAAARARTIRVPAVRVGAGACRALYSASALRSGAGAGAGTGRKLGGSLAADFDDDEGAAVAAARAERAAAAMTGAGSAAPATADAEEDARLAAEADAAVAEAQTAEAIDRLEQSMADHIAAINAKFDATATHSVGTIHTLSKGFAVVEGLPTANLGALVHFTSKSGAKVPGLVTSMDHQRCSVAVLSASELLRPGDRVSHYNGQLPSFPQGIGVVGRVLDPLGAPLDSQGPVTNAQPVPSVEQPVPSIISRARVQSMIESGIKHFDIFHPLAKGLRMGLFGPKKSGKSSLATRIVCNQVPLNKGLAPEKKLYCVYVLNGQSKAHNDKVISTLKMAGAMDFTTVVVADDSSPAAMQYLAPFAGCTAGEFFRDNGMHVLVVYDDMSSHGAAYNLMGRASGAQLPATTFVQAKILERAAHMAPDRGGGSMTALCLYERAHIDRVDALSNTEGFVDQIVYTDSSLSANGVWPPISCATVIGRPPTRYQPLFTRPVTRQMTELISHSLESARNFEWAQKLKLGGAADDDDDHALEVLHFKDKLQVLLSQERAMPLALQFMSLYAAGKDLLADVDVEDVPEWEKQLHLFMYNFNRPILYGFEQLTFHQAVPSELMTLLDDTVNRFTQHYRKTAADAKAKQRAVNQQRIAAVMAGGAPKRTA